VVDTTKLFTVVNKEKLRLVMENKNHLIRKLEEVLLKEREKVNKSEK